LFYFLVTLSNSFSFFVSCVRCCCVYQQGPSGGVAAEEADASAISPLSSAGLCRSISQSYSSPESDDGALVGNLNGSASGGGEVSAGIGVIASASTGMGTLGGGSGGSLGQQSDTDAKQQYHRSSTTANVPGEFSNRHRSQVLLLKLSSHANIRS